MPTRPSEYAECDERKILAEWEWDHEHPDLTAIFDKVAIRAAETVFDTIQDNVDMVIGINGETGGLDVTINLFGDYYITFDLMPQLLDLPNEHRMMQRRLWEAELKPLENVGRIFGNLSKEIEQRVASLRESGTLDQQYGVSYENWDGVVQPKDDVS